MRLDLVEVLQSGNPQLIGPYRLVGQLGSGGMGQVFLGLSAGGRPVAVKVIRPELAADAEFRVRFRREVAAARKVSGLFTALVVDADVDGPKPWLATAYVAGPSLSDTVSEHGPLPTESVLVLAAGLAEGLSAIHTAGVVHCDLKPSNVLLSRDGPRVIDFGISRAAEAAASATQASRIFGSPGFMSPEQADGGVVGPPSDIFSLGAVLTFAATGQGPFGAGSTPQLVDRLVHSPPNLDHLPAEMRPLIGRCLAKDPGRRPTADQVLATVGAVWPATGWLPEGALNALAQGTASAQCAVPGQVAVPAQAGAPGQVSAPAQAGAPGQDVEPGQAGTPARPAPAPAQPRADRGRRAHPARLPPDPPPSGPNRKRPRRLWRPLAAAWLVGGLLAASAGAGYALAAAGRHTAPPSAQARTATSQASSRAASPSLAAARPHTALTPSPSPSATPATSPSSPPPPAPAITLTGTYRHGGMVYFYIYYTDPGNDAKGLAFVGVNGSPYMLQKHPFSNPEGGIVATYYVAYPLNLQCGTGKQHDGYVKAWIYDAAGAPSQPVVIHLACTV